MPTGKTPEDSRTSHRSMVRASLPEVSFFLYRDIPPSCASTIRLFYFPRPCDQCLARSPSLLPPRKLRIVIYRGSLFPCRLAIGHVSRVTSPRKREHVSCGEFILSSLLTLETLLTSVVASLSCAPHVAEVDARRAYGSSPAYPAKLQCDSAQGLAQSPRFNISFCSSPI
jgi:hypothetical protein